MVSSVVARLRTRGRVAVIFFAVKGLLGWSIPKANQDESHGHGTESQADTYTLQRSESTPLAGAKDIHGDDAGHADCADGDDEKAELTFGDHGGWGFNPSMRS